LANLKRLHFDLETERLDLDGSKEEEILKFNFKRIQGLNLRMKQACEKMASLLGQFDREQDLASLRSLQDVLRYFYRTADGDGETKIVYTEKNERSSSTPLIPITLEWIIKRSEGIPVKEVLIENLIPSGILDMLQEEIKKNFKALLAYKRYDAEVLFRVRDFRTLVNLSYAVYVSEKIGISTELEPVLSFPLGPNAVSIVEAALAYQTIMTGHVYPLTSERDLKKVPIITRIVDREGEILWEYQPKPEKVLSDRVSRLVTEILRNVMENGTGRKAKDKIRVFDVPIPTFGKTGTANKFTNSSFVGFIPGCTDKKGQLDTRKGYVIASYVGYDDNRPMKAKHTTIYGASGALPLWIDTANSIVNAGDYKKNLQPADLVFDTVEESLPKGSEFIRTVPVSPVTGLPEGSPGLEMDEPLSLPGVVSEVGVRGDKWELKRHFEPLEEKTE
jgi:hypothetical protein